MYEGGVRTHRTTDGVAHSNDTRCDASSQERNLGGLRDARALSRFVRSHAMRVPGVEPAGAPTSPLGVEGLSPPCELSGTSTERLLSTVWTGPGSWLARAVRALMGYIIR